MKKSIINLLPVNLARSLFVDQVKKPESKFKNRDEKIAALKKELLNSIVSSNNDLVESLQVSSSFLLKRELLEKVTTGRLLKVEDISVCQDIILANLFLSFLLNEISEIPDYIPPVISNFENSTIYMSDIERKGKK